MNYHNITKSDMKNGPGLRVVLWVSGCNHMCPLCHNRITWDPKSGIKFDTKARKEIYDELNKMYCNGITLSGGDPLFPKNRNEIAMLVKDIKRLFPTKTVWLYTGYTWEVLMTEMKEGSSILKVILDNTDVIVDGPFKVELEDQNYHWAGSTNQRVINVKESLKEGEVILYESH